VLVVDDHPLFRDGLRGLLDTVAGIEVVDAVGDGAAAVRRAEEEHPDVVLMDLNMPRVDGVEATKQIRTRFPATQVVVLTTYEDDESVLRALRAGAIGYLTKNASRDDIRRALEAASVGHAHLDPAAHAAVLERAAAPAEPPDDLTPRELEVLKLIADGLSNKEIAARLYLGEATVKTHVNRIFAKTGSRDRAQAVAYAHRHRL
jgi:DNA-binding NarL/FixJ family response regulator